MLTRLLTYALALLSALPALAAGDFNRGLLWRIEKNGAAPSFLLGTIHLPDARVNRPSAASLRALEDARVVLTEIAFDSAKGAAAQALMLPPGQSLRAIVGEADFAALGTLAGARGVPAAIVDRLKPFGVMSLLIMPASGSEKPLDLRIWEAGQRQGAKTGALETVAEQLAAFDKISQADQVTMLRELVRQHDKIPRMLERMVALYRTEDIGAMLKAMSSGLPEAPTDAALGRRMQRALIDERNDRMVARMIPHLDRGGAFVAVGAAHLAGDRGILEQLARRGYSLTAELAK